LNAVARLARALASNPARSARGQWSAREHLSIIHDPTLERANSTMSESKSNPPAASSSEPDVLHIARLARLAIDPAHSREVSAQFARILEAFKTLATLDVEGVEPMTRPTDFTDVLRDDRERASLPVDAALANAPSRIENFYSVPKTIGGEA
jgi:aspartyl-tRNA(Asn)/glutamyl-tRNA(Gln) amidotransferase subunit C